MVISNAMASRIGDIGDGKHVASKGRDAGDNGGMPCGAVDEGGVEVLGANGVDDVDAKLFCKNQEYLLILKTIDQ